MSTSSIWGKLQTTAWVKANEQNINRILDVGVGSGTYKKLLSQSGICKDAEWVGIEIWEPYIRKYDLDVLYDRIINKSALDVSYSSIGKFDLAFAGDVLEHVTKEQSIDLVNRILECSDVLIVSIPIIHYPQGEYDGNPYETHVKDDWSHGEMLSTFGDLIFECWSHEKSDVGVYWMRKKQ
jgi:predicted TPR repeat methyltransferase